MTPTLRRLNDRERYWGLTWPAWIAAAAAGGVLYGAVKLSPFGFKPTVTIVALLIALFAMVLLGVSGQALSPGRQLQAIARYRRSPKRWELPDGPDRRGLVLAVGPEDFAEGEDVDVAARPRGRVGSQRLCLVRRGRMVDRPGRGGGARVRRTRPGSLGSVLPVSLVEPDGLIVTTDGRYVRVIECDRLPNTITADPSELQRIETASRTCAESFPTGKDSWSWRKPIRFRSPTRSPPMSGRRRPPLLGTGSPASRRSRPRVCD